MQSISILNVQIHLTSLTRIHKIHHILVYALPPISSIYFCKCCPNSSMSYPPTLMEFVENLLLILTITDNSLQNSTPLLQMLPHTSITKKVIIIFPLNPLQFYIHPIFFLDQCIQVHISQYIFIYLYRTFPKTTLMM